MSSHIPERLPRLYPNLIEAVYDNLYSIFMEDRYADRVIEYSFKKHPRWGARDRTFVAHTTYEMVRNWRFLCAFIRLDYRDIRPDDLYTLLGAFLYKLGYTLPDWTEFRRCTSDFFHRRQDEFKPTPAERESFPDWLDKRGRKELGDLWFNEMVALNEEADVILRVNTLRTDINKLREDLAMERINAFPIEGYPDALQLKERANVFRTEGFKLGLFEVQDASSQLVAPFLQVGSGMRVIDACAGAGGKTLHMASLMENKGRIIAMDVEAYKLDELKKRTRRSGAQNIETRVIDSGKSIKRLYNTADRLLLDVPCSGLGVLRRNPDTKWKLNPEMLERVQETQRDILEKYAPMCAVGGKMVYATCSIFPSENEEQVNAFLNGVGKNFEIEEEQKIFASIDGYDGFYMARLVRKS